MAEVCFIVQKASGREGSARGFLLCREEWGHPSPHHNAVLWGGGDLQTCTGRDAIAPCTPVDAVYVPTELKEKRTAGPLPRLTHA